MNVPFIAFVFSENASLDLNGEKKRVRIETERNEH